MVKWDDETQRHPIFYEITGASEMPLFAEVVNTP